MAGYCLLIDVQRRMPHLALDLESTPTIGDAQMMIDECAANIIDPTIQIVTSLPVTDANGLSYLKELNILGTLAMIYRAAQIEESLAATYQNIFDKMLKDMRNNPQILVKSTSGGAAPTTHTTREPIFEMETNQW